MKVIGYLIGGIFAIGVFVPLGFASWLIYDRSAVLLSTTLEDATIESCYYQRVHGSSRGSASWGPVAVAANGVKVKGGFKWNKKSWCESGIGSKVSVFIHPSDSGKNRINTFFQFWFLPIALLLFCVIFYPAAYSAKRRKNRKV